MVRLEPKAPTEIRNYLIDWTAFLGEDTIATSTVTVSGVTLNSTTHDDTSVTVFVSAGLDGTTARITNTIITAGGLTETETFALQVSSFGEPISLAEAKAYLRVLSSDEDAKIEAMIPRARRWVEDHTGLALVQRSFTERLLPSSYGIIRLSKGPVVSVESVDYIDSSGTAATLTPTLYPPTGDLIYADGWPSLATNERFEIAYTAGYTAGEVDDRLIGGMLALIEGEYAEGYAYPPRATEATERCCAYLRQMVA